MTIIRQKPKNRKNKAVMPYWMPMTLWSVEKTSEFQNPASSWWASWTLACGMAGAVACIILLELVEHHHRQQQREVQKRRIKQLPRACDGRVADKLESKPDKQQPENQRADEINRASQMEQERTHAHHQQGQCETEGLAACAAALRVDDGQHLEACARVLVPINPGNGHKVRQ